MFHPGMILSNYLVQCIQNERLAQASHDRAWPQLSQVHLRLSNPAPRLTQTASKQTYYTIRFLVDPARVDDAYRAYGYFRWVDDVLDAASDPSPVPGAAVAAERRAFLQRQASLLDACYRGEWPLAASAQENMLVDLVRRNPEKNSGLHAYLRHMLLVMDFDARRRGRLISQVELSEYTRWLATAVTEAMHYFIGPGAFAPHDETRYLAVSAAHIAHMLRDTLEDVQNGYYNIPREVLEAQHIGPQDVHHPAYRAWVRSRVQLARAYFQAGQDYIERAQCARYRLAGLAYIARFIWVLDTIEREDYCLRPAYADRKSLGAGLRMGWLTLSSLIAARGPGAAARPAVSRPLGKL